MFGQGLHDLVNYGSSEGEDLNGIVRRGRKC